VRPDAGRLEQVMSNLLTNAYRYGGANVDVSAAVSNGRVTIRVADDGPGVEAGLEASVFEPFARGGQSQSFGGSGLGLAIVKSLCQSMGGDVVYERGADGGAVFAVTLQAGAE
jgi:signal transduction histidine kinase